ncbi:MAG TPA: amino acid adenylation domain-containing protein, partial [Ktedonobacteraceae bacterium]|nr:amino acid adenylation domain-containing protein [Ktedonobacteraceae bacterium]
PPLLPVSRDDPLPLSFAQQRLWFLEQFEPGSAAYHVPLVLRLTGPLQRQALHESLHLLIGRHESLRTTFESQNGQPVQRIHPPEPLPMPCLDLSTLPADQRATETTRLAAQEAERLFDLSQGPLLRTWLLHLEEQVQVLLVTMHHIITDAWSLTIFLRELATLYEAQVRATPVELAALPIHYADFALWQRRWLQGGQLARQLTYWQRQLQNAPAALNLPTDLRRPEVFNFQGATHPFLLCPTLSRKLKALSRSAGVTLFMTLLAAFQTLLCRYTAQEDILVGSPIANRTRTEVEGLIGFFVNMLVLRADLSGNPSFREVLDQVRETALEAYVHQDLPFEQLVETLHIERELDRPPLVQVAFVWQNASQAIPDLADVHLDLLDMSTGTAKFELTLLMEETSDGLRGVFEYSTTLFEAATIARLEGHWKTLLESIISDPTCPIADLALLAPVERTQMLEQWNVTQVSYPRDTSLHERFEVQVARNSDALALVCGEEQVTYHELNRRANQLAHYLQRLGVGPEVRVGLCLKRSVELVVGLLSILKAGGAYVPLDPSYPAERLSFILLDSQVSVLLTQSELLEQLPPQGRALVVCLDTTWAQVTQEPGTKPTSGVQPDNLAYIIYTSGSTGKPKGVSIEHRNVLALLSWACETFPAADLSGVLLSTSICFDLSVFELFAPLSRGGWVLLCDNALQLPTLAFAPTVTLLNTVPSVASELVRLQAIPSSVRTVNLAGEPLPAQLACELYHLEHLERVYNLYGPSEDTTYSTAGLVERGNASTPSLGRPLPHKEGYVLDKYFHPVPIGVPGELYLGGMGLARGYLNRPDLTAERFLPHPFSQQPGARLYRTGDLVRYLPNGVLEFLGRLDHQVKLRGFRIELGEIEATLRQHLLVREALVLVREDVSGEKKLVAYVIFQEGKHLPASELQRFLKQKLPAYMVPTAFVVLDSFPLSANGKIERRALPDPSNNRPQLESTYVAPQTSTEQALSMIWKDLLRLKEVGIQDSFFDLGGHSLLLLQLQGRIRDVLYREISLVDLFRYPTIQSCSMFIEQALHTTDIYEDARERAESRKAAQRQIAKNKRKR